MVICVQQVAYGTQKTKGDVIMTNTHEAPNAATQPKIHDVTAQHIRRCYLDYRNIAGVDTSYDVGYSDGRADAIVWLLDELGIVIEKVNTP